VKFKDKLQVKVTSELKGEVWHFKLMKINRYRNFEIGKLEVDFAREKKYFVISSHVDTAYRNNGFGKLLYEKALKKFGKLKTDYFEASEDAQRVWISLCKKYKSKKFFFIGTLTLYNKLK
jgi:GNAT superfamily N-acetyltransferase